MHDRFDAFEVAIFAWMTTYDRDGYLAMLGTQSSYALLDADRRGRLFDAVGRLVDERLGGTVTKQYVCVVAVARARDGAT